MERTVTHDTRHAVGAAQMCAGMLFSGMCALAVAAAAPPRVKLIVDTDMSTDCDDVGALCIAHALADAGEVDLVAAVHNTGVDTGVCAVWLFFFEAPFD